ncbi:ABC transporter substrate-binding protein [Microbacterium phyllosphaerae]|uniref:ABC transporter substrate-binding protein n=1 Tax=Microbacterium phyllosphaerae TaxID=124798 RepID=UPI003D648414
MSRGRFIGGVITSVAIVVALVGCAGGATDDADDSLDDKVLTIGTTSDVASFDPAQVYYANAHQYLLPAYDTLIRLDENNQLVPMLAVEWGYLDEDKKEFELTLRSDVTFSDGTPLTAEVAAASLQRFKEANGPGASGLATVESIEPVDDEKLRLTLSMPTPSLEYVLTQVAGMITNPAAAADELASVPSGAGPYVLDEEASRRGDVYVFVRNDDYYDSESFPYSEIDLRVVTDSTARLNAVKTGQIDVTYGIASQLSEAKASGLNVVSAPGDWYGVFLSDRLGASTPALADVRVRQAINYAIDGDALLETVGFGEGTPTTQIFAAGTPAYDDGLNDAYPFDPDKARDLLEEAGFEDGFVLRMPSLDSLLPEAYPIVQQQLADVGITVEYDPVTASAGVTPFVSGEYSAYIFLWGASQNWIDATQLLSAAGPLNPFRVDDPKVSALMAEIAVAQGDEQEALYRELSDYIVEQAWFAPWYAGNTLTFAGADVEVTPQPQAKLPPIYNYRPAD